MPTRSGPIDPSVFVHPGALDAKADEVPTARQVNGKWQTGTMPSADGVHAFIDRLTSGDIVAVDVAPHDQLGLALYNRWYETFRDEHAPITDWADPLDESEEALLANA